MSAYGDKIPRLVKKETIDNVAHTIERVSAGNFSGSTLPPSGTLAPIIREINALKKNIGREIVLLDEERNRLSHIVDVLPDAILLFEEDQLILFNAAATRLFGIVQTHVHKTMADIPLPQSIKLELKKTAARVEGRAAAREAGTSAAEAKGQTLSIIVDFDRFQNTYKVTSTQFPAQNANRAMELLSITDTTKQSKNDLMRKDFVIAASHELKTPVAGINLIGETALLALEDGDVATVHSFLEQIQTEARGLQHLVSDLLDLSRYERETSEIHAIIDMIPVVKTITSTRRKLAADENVSLETIFKTDDTEELLVRANETDLTIILDNLIDNALTYTDRGTVTVTVGCEKSSGVISVCDTGIGIAPEDISRIFERFYRVDKSRSRRSGGTGLGLALVKHAVREIGGEISVSSDFGKGTCFTVTLPLAR
ncbi:MAG: ATP-binding protein [Coriobacteriia bacterium]|nr:ATP-binding protein [Coriobacteriia bacterium]